VHVRCWYRWHSCFSITWQNPCSRRPLPYV